MKKLALILFFAVTPVPSRAAVHMTHVERHGEHGLTICFNNLTDLADAVTMYRAEGWQPKGYASVEFDYVDGAYYTIYCQEMRR